MGACSPTGKRHVGYRVAGNGSNGIHDRDQLVDAARLEAAESMVGERGERCAATGRAALRPRAGRRGFYGAPGTPPRRARSRSPAPPRQTMVFTRAAGALWSGFGGLI